jgi:uncharacterized iron-regulated membrane protein
LGWNRFRNALQTVHLWAGIILSLPFVLLGISGSILMLQPEVPRWAQPHASARGEQQSLEAILIAARAAAPSENAVRIGLPEAEGLPANVRFDPADLRRGDNRRGNLVYIDPVSLEVLGKVERPRPGQLFNFMRTLHATLYVRTISDRSFVGWMGIALALMCVSGLVLWWPRRGQWRNALWIKQGARGFRLHRDLHSAIGFWSLLLLLIISVSGLYLAFPRTFREAVESVLPTGQNFEDAEVAAVELPEAVNTVDDAVSAAVAALPDAMLQAVQLPNRPDGVMVLDFAPRGLSFDAPGLTVSVEPTTGAVIYVDDPRDYAIGERLILWQRWLHSGLGLGLVWRVLVFVSGFLPLFFAFTGIWMWLIKRRRRRELGAEEVPAPAE